MPDLLSALDARIAAEPEPRPSRPEMIRRMLADSLQGSAAVAGDNMAEFPSNKADDARAHASGIVDAEMREMEGSPAQKRSRRKALTDGSGMVADAKAQRRRARDVS